MCDIFHSMKCTLLSEMQKGLLQRGDCCMTCELKVNYLYDSYVML